jgi:hypothetical protein
MTTSPNTSTLAGLSIVTALSEGVLVPTVCPTWFCAEDHAGEETGDLVDVNHASAHVDVYAPRFDGDGDELFAFAFLAQDVYAARPQERAPYVVVEAEDDEMCFTPDQANVFANNLTRFADEIRVLAQAAREQMGSKDCADADSSFSTALDAIQAAVNTSGNLPRTRTALLNAVGLYADEARS